MICITLDDEPLALDLLEVYIQKVDFLELKGAFSNPFEASDFMQKNKIDLVFLDIQMPDITGIQWLKSIENPPIVIFTTAYSQYALEGFNLDVLDYLLKPFDFERFFKAATKANDYFLLLQKPDNEVVKDDFIFVKADYQNVKINFDEILHIESMDDYCRIFLTSGKPVLTLMALKNLVEMLPAAQFKRVHRSHIINLTKVEKMTKKTIFIGKKEIPIGERYKDLLK